MNGLGTAVLANSEYCTGCGCCAAVCAKHAIEMKQSDVDGFLYPYIDKEKCVDCGLCEQACPALHRAMEHKTEKFCSNVYAARAIGDGSREYSASGGVFPVFATEILNHGGCVVGVAWEGKTSVRHCLIQDKNDLVFLRGTKYFQSRMGDIYGQIQKVLNQRKHVLFCGMPCQVRAVENYCKIKGHGDGLILVDLLCRGIPSPKAYEHWIWEEEEKREDRIRFVQIKEKRNGWDKIGTRITFEDGNEIYYSLYENAFMDSFLRDNISIRNSCYHCPYKTVKRSSDLTIGDFWGYRNPGFADNKGTSVVIVNSEKGRRLLEAVRQNLKIAPSTMWRVLNGNRAAFDKLEENRARDVFWKLLDEHSFTTALEMARDWKRLDCEKLADVPDGLEVVNVGTAQAKYAFDYQVVPANGYNMALYMNPLMYNIEILRNNRQKIALGAFVLITLEYPIFLCANSHEHSVEEERRIREAHGGYVQEEIFLRQLGKRNARINHEKLWEIDREIYDLIHLGWEQAIGIKGIVLQNKENEQVRIKRKYAVEDLEDLIIYCRNMSWIPILVGLPYSRELNQYVPQAFKEKNFYELIELVRKKTGIAFYDYSEDPRFASLDNYMNVWFLNDRGRKKFTRVVYEEIMQGKEKK